MLETIRQQIAGMVAHGHEPAAIIMTPWELKRFIAQTHPGDLRRSPAGSGYELEGLPIYRSWEISGPAIVSREVLALLRREYRTHWLPGDYEQPARRAQSDLLF